MHLHRVSPATAVYTVESPEFGDMGVMVLPGGAIHIDKPTQILSACEVGSFSRAIDAAEAHRNGRPIPYGVEVTTGGEPVEPEPEGVPE